MKKYPKIHTLDLKALRKLIKDIDREAIHYDPRCPDTAKIAMQRSQIEELIRQKESKTQNTKKGGCNVPGN